MKLFLFFVPDFFCIRNNCGDFRNNTEEHLETSETP